MTSPFDEAKYLALLNGLEATEVSFRDLETIIDYRIEAEFFDKRFLHTEGLFKKIEWKSFFKIADYENGRAYSSDEFGVEGGLKVSKIGDVTNKRLIANWGTLSYSEFFNQKGTKLVEDDILMSLTGDPPDVGKVNLVSNVTELATFNQRVARVFLRQNQSDFVSTKVFFAVLANRHCREQLERFAKGIRQRNLGIECLELLKIPIFKRDFQLSIDKLIIKSFEQSKIQQSKYQEAEALLLEQLGLIDWKPNNENTAMVSVVDSFLSSGRLDAEYYQPKYDELLEKIKRFDHEPLINLVSINKSIETGSEAYSDEGIPYIRVSDISKFGIDQPSVCISNEYYQENKTLLDRLKVKKETILLSKDGSIGIAYTVYEDLEMLTSGALLHLKLKSKRVLPDYLTLVLNSIVVQQQAERDGGGSIIVHWRVSEIEKVVIPIVSEIIQRQITSLVRQSQSAQSESKRLLALAKEAVEVAIEQNEETAEKLISSQIANNQ